MNSNDNSEMLDAVKVQEQNQIYFNVPVDNSEMEDNVKVQEQKQIYLNVPVNINDNSELMGQVKVQEQKQIFLNAPIGAKESKDMDSPTMNQYLQHCADKAMISNKSNTMQQQINMPSLDNGGRYEEVKYQMEGLALGNDAKYEKLNYNLEGSTEEVVIPDDVPQVSPELEHAK